eukprot:TRINITY_DN62161_c0_g1_i1.p1 TRINITY_DN62161_c0_g1~~TRINITY_DN62161_c0_g1_i1.p1  ORF type:complete len:599 (+),score=149.63 TRINITY_DN62161_c0_g1_i1:70-1866(+)
MSSLANRLAQVKPIPASVQLLEKQLKNGQPFVRDAGLVSITKVKPPAEPMTDLLQKLIEDENWYVRRSVAAAVTRCAELDSAATLAIHNVAGNRMDHKDQDVRQTAARALVAVVQSANGEEVIDSSGLGVRKPFVLAKKKNKKQPSRTVSDGEETSAPPDDDDVRSVASEHSVEGCAEAGAVPASAGQLALEEICIRMQHKDPDVRKLAIESLTALGTCAERFAVNIAKALADSDLRVRLAAFESIAALEDTSNPAMGEVALLLRHPDITTRNLARKTVNVMKKWGGPLITEAVVKQLKLIDQQKKDAEQEKDQDARKRGAANRKDDRVFGEPKTCQRFIFTVLCDLGPLIAPHSKVLAEYLEEPDLMVRAALVRCLITGGAEVAVQAIKPLRKRLDHPDPAIQLATVDVLKGLAPLGPVVGQTIGKLILEDASDSSPEVLRFRKHLLQILSASGKYARRFLPDMARELEHQDFQVRRAAVEAFVDLGEHAIDGCYEIGRRLLHADPVVRRATVETIGQMGEVAQSLLGKVENLMESEEDEDVQNAIRKCLDMACQGGFFTAEVVTDKKAAKQSREAREDGKRRKSFDGTPKRKTSGG